MACNPRLWTSSHSRTASGVACPHCPWTGNAVEQCRAWHAINALGKYIRKDDVGRAIVALGQHRRSDNVGRGMPSPPLDSTHGRMMSGVACHHHPWTAHTVVRRRAWHDLTALGQHTQLDYVGRGMTSPPLDSTHGRTTSAVACHHCLWVAHTIE